MRSSYQATADRFRIEEAHLRAVCHYMSMNIDDSYKIHNIETGKITKRDLEARMYMFGV